LGADDPPCGCIEGSKGQLVEESLLIALAPQPSSLPSITTVSATKVPLHYHNLNVHVSVIHKKKNPQGAQASLGKTISVGGL
jgi:hypothetical protein